MHFLVDLPVLLLERDGLLLTHFIVLRSPGTLSSQLETLGRSLCRRGISREAAATTCAAHGPST